MRKAGLIALISLLLSGCSFTGLPDLRSFLPTPVPPSPTATATIYLSPTASPTITPTQPTPTFTLTPTLIYPNGTPIPSTTPNPDATLWVLPTGTGTPEEQPLLGNGPFATVLVPGKELFWGSCDPNVLKITVQLQSGVRAVGVVMALRLQDTQSAEHTEWGQAIMDKHDGGVYTYDLTAKAFTHYREYKLAYGQYQFIAYTTGLAHVGSSQVYLNDLTIKPCP